MAIQLTPKQLEEVASSNFGSVYTNPLSSMVVRTAVLGILAFLVKQFGWSMDDAAMQGWVDTILAVSVLALVIWARVKSKGMSITTLQDAVNDYLPMFQQATPAVRTHLLQVLQKQNPKVYEHLTTQYPDLIRNASSTGPNKPS